MRLCGVSEAWVIGAVAAIVVAAAWPAVLRAQTPANPLRPAAAAATAAQESQEPAPLVTPVPSPARELPGEQTPAAEPQATPRRSAGGLALPPPTLPTPLPPPAMPPPAMPPSVVPPTFGRPELLPTPSPLLSPDENDLPREMAPPGEPAFGPPLGDEAAWQHLVHPWFDEPWFSHSDPNDPHRHRGIGQPLVGTSWRNRPWFFGTFVGGVLMNDLIPHRVYQNDTGILGARLGLDFDHYWGLEGRWAFANPELTNAAGTPLPNPSRDYFADVSLVYYPFGDARWRPYLLAGLGFQTFRFNNDLGLRISESSFEVPLGFGVKYFYGPWFTLRFDFADNLALGNARVSGMHNVSFMVGAEFRFGGRRPSYFPWHNNTAYW